MLGRRGRKGALAEDSVAVRGLRRLLCGVSSQRGTESGLGSPQRPQRALGTPGGPASTSAWEVRSCVWDARHALTANIPKAS